MAGEGRGSVVARLVLVLVCGWAAGGEEKLGDAEKERLRRAALALMPKTSRGHGRRPYLCTTDRDKVETGKAIEAWERLLALDPNDAEAKMHLAVCLVSLHLQDLLKARAGGDPAAAKECLRATQLADAAVRASASPDNAATYSFIALELQSRLPERAAEMCDHIVANPKSFEDWHVANAKHSLSNLRPQTILPELQKAIANAGKDPDTLCKLANLMLNNSPKMPDQVLEFASKHADSPNPLVRFLFEVASGEMLFRYKKDPAALAHYDRAIEVHEAAYAAAPDMTQRSSIDDVYRRKLVACQVFHRPDEARKTVLDGAKHFMAAGRFNSSISWLYFYCVTEVLKEGEEKDALAICDACLKAAARDPKAQNAFGARILEVKERLTARLESRPLPTFARMALIQGTETDGLYAPRMAVAAGKLWLAWQPWQSGGPALVHKVGTSSAEKLDGLPQDLRGVAVAGDRVFFGGRSGLHRLDTDGKLLKHYTRKDGPLPGDHVVDLCEGGGKLFLSLCKEEDRGRASYVVAELDPATEKLRILAPSGPGKPEGAEPTVSGCRLWWDSVSSRLYANSYMLSGSPRVWVRHGWMQADGGWKTISPRAGAVPRYILSDGGEALQASQLEDKSLFEFLKAGEKLTVDLPVPECVGEAAWDATRLWVPGFLGLHQVERKTGKAAWLAHQEKTQCTVVLKHAGKLYVATTRGLYVCDVPQ